MSNIEIETANLDSTELDHSKKNIFTQNEVKLYSVSTQDSLSNISHFSDQERFFQSVLGNREDVVINEKWDISKSKIIDGIIEELTKEYAFVICLIDAEKRKLKKKAFPIQTISSIYPLETGKFVRLIIRQKTGSIRYDFYDGSNLIPSNRKELLSAEFGWAELNEFPMDNPSDME